MVLSPLGVGALRAWSMQRGSDSRFFQAREAMVREVLADMAATAGETGRGTLSAAVLEAMRRVPRHRFVADTLIEVAYENRPLPIGYGQTISQPFIVALMTELLDLPENAKVLEIGTGSGYQAAVLAHVAKEVYSVEILAPLGRSAETRLKALGYTNVHVKIDDGYYGWKEHAPFDGILVTAAAPHIPPPLLQQLKPGAKLVIPVGPPFLTQFLTVVHKSEDGTMTTRQVLPVAFVPLTRSGGRP
ncbi:protein-L-isoaspartate(D-aspartate) O-methyltransferase [Desulfosoma caldarium]